MPQDAVKKLKADPPPPSYGAARSRKLKSGKKQGAEAGKNLKAESRKLKLKEAGGEDCGVCGKGGGVS